MLEFKEFEKHGVKYKGELKGGVVEGLGLLHSAQSIYIGQFRRGQFHGRGSYLDLSSRYLFVGEFKNHLKQGLGKGETYKSEETFRSKIEGLLRFSDIDVENYEHYIGEILASLDSLLLKIAEKIQNMKASMAKLETGDPLLTENFMRKRVAKEEESKHCEYSYIGEFKQDQRNGLGMLNYGNGEEYRGAFQQDSRSGFGVICCPRKYIYVGNFARNQFSGEGKLLMVERGELRMITGRFERGEVEQGAEVKVEKEGAVYSKSKGVIEGKLGERDVRIESIEAQGEGGGGSESRVTLDGRAFMKMKGERVKVRFGGGSTYDGILEKGGELSGKAKVQLEDGSMFGGEMRDGLAEGKGKVAFVSGEIWEGVFEEHEPVGKARLEVREGGGWWEGEYIGGRVYERSSVYSSRI